MIRPEIIRIIPMQIRGLSSFRELCEKKSTDKTLEEIRFRIGQYLVMRFSGEEVELKREGIKITEQHMREILEYVSRYSLFAYEHELKQGYITIEGGHRIGLVGRAIIENGRIKTQKYISSINIRIAHEVPGCAERIIPYIVEDKTICHTLIISPPRCGKTTMLRDIIRIVSDGNENLQGCTVGVVDERSEICASFQGIPQNYIGKRTDVFDACPKVEGMNILIRTMSPAVVAVDEIGTSDEVHAIEYAMYCGCKILATVHGMSIQDIQKRPIVNQLITQKRFERYIVLDADKKRGTVRGIYNERGNCLYQDIW